MICPYCNQEIDTEKDKFSKDQSGAYHDTEMDCARATKRALTKKVQK